jgi:hypothetical protein
MPQRQNTPETETEDLKAGDPPRPKTEPNGSEGSSDTPKTKTDPATGAPHG